MNGDGPTTTRLALVRWIAAVAAVLAISISAAVYYFSRSDTFDVVGQLQMPLRPGATDGTCSPAALRTVGALSDLMPGTPVVIVDEHGSSLASGSLQAPKRVPLHEGVVLCHVPFAVHGVPEGLPQYGVRIGDRPTRILAGEALHSPIWVLVTEEREIGTVGLGMFFPGAGSLMPNQ
ncbi:hypothetical protein [Catellatospora chokoriensis]|nr:hypothetical protein [Catellatospora chokoriensis]